VLLFDPEQPVETITIGEAEEEEPEPEPVGIPGSSAQLYIL
jgi:hypothetical protein